MWNCLKHWWAELISGRFCLLEKPNERCRAFPILCSTANERAELSVEMKSYAYNIQPQKEHGNMLMLVVLADKAISAGGDTVLNREIQMWS